MRLADISWPSRRERAAECIPGPTERAFVYSLRHPSVSFLLPAQIRYNHDNEMMKQERGTMAKQKIIAEVPVLRVRYPQHGESRLGTKPVRFKGGIAGQRVQIQVQKRKKEYYEAKILSVTMPAKVERRVPCKPFGVCGGCTYQRLYYPDELIYKEAQLRELFGDAGIDLTNFVLHASPKDRAYRNKMEYSFGNAEKDGPMILGLHRKGRFHDIVDTTTCNIVDEDFETIRKATMAFYREKEVPHYNRLRHEGVLRHLVIRSSETRPMITVHLVTSSQGDPLIDEYAAMLQQLRLYSRITGFIHSINDGMGDVVRTDASRIVFGSPDIMEVIHDLEFRISPLSFFQTNTKGAELLYERAVAACGDLSDKVVFDLYSGTGTIGQILSKHAKQVVAVEIAPEAVTDARENAKRNHIKNIIFWQGDVLAILDDLRETPDLIVVDPPRSGIHPRAIPKIARTGAPQIVYVSCNPVTLVKDLDTFREWGYEIARIESVDMFPRTPHVETVVLMSRVDK